MRWDGQLVGVHYFLGRARTNEPAGVAWPAPVTRSKGASYGASYEPILRRPESGEGGAREPHRAVLHALGLITPSAPTAKEWGSCVLQT